MMGKKKDEDRKPIEQEIAELQRKFRVLENDKRACSEDSQGTIRKQRATIEKLTRENRKMKSELNETRDTGGSGPEVKIINEHLGKLGDQRLIMTGKLEAEDAAAAQLDEGLESTQKHILHLRQEMAKNGGVNAALDNDKAVQKQIRVLENRLDQSMMKFNNSVTSNGSLREEINKLRRERGVFDSIYRKLENELQHKKKEMANIIEQANAAYEARDSAQSQMASLKQQADKEHAEFEKEWKELGRLIENDKRMKEFMRSKAPTDHTKEAPQDAAKHLGKSATKFGETTKSAVALNANLHSASIYEQGFAQIQNATGICDIDELVRTFIESEDENYSLNKFNVELREEIEKLEEIIGSYKEEIIILSGKSTRKEDTDRAKLLETLEERWNEIDRRAVHYEVKYQEAQQTLSHIRACVQSVFMRLGCQEEDLPAGCGGGISEANMSVYLRIVEQQANELLKLYDTVNPDGDEGATKPRRAGPATLNIKLPSTVEDYSDNEDEEDEDDQRPFTRDELKTKTMRVISKKQKKTNRKTANSTGE
mmetsp:Transcript_83675/g.148012  ORF Transcript_83675/g.148012 Transcript_83675/m.148012 type:complete len:540 (-) Transcript_83675:606-2225(-)|eukprot:CAMPEP_0197703514 /NCGR_PEP_ID=MMETSP1338-20131121/125476_1 /TAXON_ID=43686 ORGANISM="Pelagodinium beii, Strain RCC1491" /NCGR_SAMPLE_ID=MMETSP1338 /ASSEMBLY_ACC=CAM_ASM_000754 /LENGTH=539 /DNA_ID=CAMNT_0043287411 /DNA_START=56 /DNA_END=1675 /DNA_ORIENTATION=+